MLSKKARLRMMLLLMLKIKTWIKTWIKTKRAKERRLKPLMPLQSKMMTQTNSSRMPMTMRTIGPLLRLLSKTVLLMKPLKLSKARKSPSMKNQRKKPKRPTSRWKMMLRKKLRRLRTPKRSLLPTKVRLKSQKMPLIMRPSRSLNMAMKRPLKMTKSPLLMMLVKLELPQNRMVRPSIRAMKRIETTDSRSPRLEYRFGR